MTLLNSLKIEDTSSSGLLQLPIQSSNIQSGSTSTNLQILTNGDKENNNPARKKIRQKVRPSKDKRNKMKTDISASDLVCVYCNISFTDRADFQVSIFSSLKFKE